MSKAWITISILVIIILGFLILSGSKEKGFVLEEVDLTGVVTYKMVLGTDGYEPNEITINKGEAIVFSTTEDDLYWPASNIHPSHTIYSEFDPMVPVSPDQTWAFIFDKVGSWKFHDHLNPIWTGVINVVE